MMSINFLILFSFLFNLLAPTPLNNPSDFNGLDYPFSIKKGYDEAEIFLNNDINIFDVSQTASSPL